MVMVASGVGCGGSVGSGRWWRCQYTVPELARVPQALNQGKNVSVA